ncbi:hypothetical protein [Salinivibrio proteolyticus]|uniref:hypothetical protein n=1 Tax=Salinivibrio proteolyticus TaxID=334715 RepID=UPI000988F82B|nr:hypothetical protein [Salinivibrio proteolyticus]OOF30361.1 hypothetical protein BZJ20_10870 [Salinivibrio proteolyticus]
MMVKLIMSKFKVIVIFIGVICSFTFSQAAVAGASGHANIQACYKVDTNYDEEREFEYTLSYSRGGDNYSTHGKVKIPANSTIGDEICDSTLFHKKMKYTRSIYADYKLTEVSTGKILAEKYGVDFHFNAEGSKNNYWLAGGDTCENHSIRFRDDDSVTTKGMYYGCSKNSGNDKVDDDERVFFVWHPRSQTADLDIIERCTVFGNTDCIPFGSGNSGNFIQTESLPEGSYDTVTVSYGTSQTMSFSFSAGLEYEFGADSGPTLGLGLDFGVEQSTSSERDLTTLYTTKDTLRNDIGSKLTYLASRKALKLQEDMMDWTGEIHRLANPEEALGESLWKSIDLSTTSTWEDTVTSSNCKPNNLVFLNLMEISRPAIWLNDMDDTATRDRVYPLSSSIVIGTECIQDKSGHYFRRKKQSLL